VIVLPGQALAMIPRREPAPLSLLLVTIVGAQLTEMVKLCGPEVSTPPLATPPLSWRVIVIVAAPLTLVVGVKVSVPLELIAGPAENNPGLVLPVTLKVSVWPDSLAGPAEIFVAQFATVWAPTLALTDWSGPLVNEGASLTELTVMVKFFGADVSCPPLAGPPLFLSTTV